MNQDSLLHDYTGEINAGEASLRAVPDVDLVERVARRDQAAFAELYRRFSGMLLSFLSGLLSDGAAAEESAPGSVPGSLEGRRALSPDGIC